MSPLDFYHKFMWKFVQTGQGERFYGCTKCGQLIQSYEETIHHCHEQSCDRKDEIDWLENLKP